jgi:hypothetical protein
MILGSLLMIEQLLIVKLGIAAWWGLAGCHIHSIAL